MAKSHTQNLNKTLLKKTNTSGAHDHSEVS